MSIRQIFYSKTFYKYASVKNYMLGSSTNIALHEYFTTVVFNHCYKCCNAKYPGLSGLNTDF